MVKGFSKRKLILSQNLAEKLKSTREQKNLSILDVEIGTKIKARYLEAVESGDWLSLPSPVYTRGFVLAYAKYLNLDKREILDLFDTELKYQKSRGQTQLVYEKSLKDVKVLVTPKLLGYGLLGLFVLSMFTYIIYQVSIFAGSPNLQIVSPNNNTVVEDDSVDIRGITDTDIFLTVNGENVPVANDGHFATNLKLHRGINIIKVQASGKPEKETSEVLTVEYKPKTAMTDLPTNP